MPLTLADQDRLLRIERGLREHPFPPQLVIENTSHCNIRCVHCSHRELIRPRRHMARWLWDKIVEEVGSELPECEVWPTFYGEALILGRNGELWHRLDGAARAGCTNLVLNSNGTLLDRWGNVERILDSPLRRFILSLDGFSAPVFESVRVGARRDHVYWWVEELLRRKAQRGQTYPVIVCQFSLMKQNRHEVETFRRYWLERGAEVKTRSMLEWSRSGSVRAENIDHETSFRIACPWANNTMGIHQDGRVVACVCDYEGRFTVGTAAERSVKELWRALGERLRALHRQHRWEQLPAICRGCGDWQVAGAHYDPEQVPGTRPFWFYETGAPAAPVQQTV